MPFGFERKQYEKEAASSDNNKDGALIPVEVIALNRIDGTMVPKALTWNDLLYPVDRVIKMQKASSHKTDGSGWRYLCQIRNKQVYLFRKDAHWFLEGK